MLQILIRFQIVGFCRLNDAVNNSAGLCPLNRVNDMPVGSPNAEWAYGSLACLSAYWDKQAYVQNIFILIFCPRARNKRYSMTKGEDNYFTSIHRSVRIHPHRRAIKGLPHSIQGCFDPLPLLSSQAMVSRRFSSFGLMSGQVSLRSVPAQHCSGKDPLPLFAGTYAGKPSSAGLDGPV